MALQSKYIHKYTGDTGENISPLDFLNSGTAIAPGKADVAQLVEQLIRNQ
jgi:hypothetical protein